MRSELLKETLLNQMQMNELTKKNFGKMTQVEKKLNIDDLRNYKNKQPTQVNSMIPGIKNIPSVGSKPLMRGALKMMEDPTSFNRKKGNLYFSPERHSTSHEYFAFSNG